jgi:ABC-type transport system involved in multi-copper enzyme maturation permease subunit
MSNVYTAVTNKYKDSDFIFIVFVMAVLGLGASLWMFVEDTASSYYGWQTVEQAFGMTATIWEFTYIVLSLLPQIGSVLMTHIAMSHGDGDGGWMKWAAGATAFEGLDYVFDLIHRSTQFEVMAKFATEQNAWNGLGVFSVLALTFLFTVASLFLLTLSLGIVVSSWADVRKRYDKNATSIRERQRTANQRQSQERAARQQAGGSPNLGNPQRDNRRS